jgi:hypothetical protein
MGGWLILLDLFFLPVSKLWVPRPCVFCKGGYGAADTMGLSMTSGLHRTYGAHHLHFNTCSCYRRLPFLRSARARDQFLVILEQTRRRYRFVVVGCRDAGATAPLKAKSGLNGAPMLNWNTANADQGIGILRLRSG